MKRNFTQHDLILYIYNELPESRKLALQGELNENLELKQEYEQLLKIQNRLNSIHSNPNPTSIDIILEESASISRLETH